MALPGTAKQQMLLFIHVIVQTLLILPITKHIKTLCLNESLKYMFIDVICCNRMFSCNCYMNIV